jgi:hypothetical protein
MVEDMSSGFGLNVRDFGAKGDGIADDSVAINACIAAASAITRGKYIHIPKGDYKISSPITVNRPIVLQGEGGGWGNTQGGTRLLPDSGITAVMIMNGSPQGSGAVLNDIQILGPGAAADWEANHAYSTGAIVRGLFDGNQNHFCLFRANAAGTSGSSEPKFNAEAVMATSSMHKVSGTVSVTTLAPHGFVDNQTVYVYTDGADTTLLPPGHKTVAVTGASTFTYPEVGADYANNVNSATAVFGEGDIVLDGAVTWTAVVVAGVRMLYRASLNNCGIYDIQGNGILIWSSSLLGGNVNGWKIYGGAVYNCGQNGVLCRGGDSNAGVATGIDFLTTAGGYWCVYDSSFLGNTWTACEAVAEAATTNGAYKADNANARSMFSSCYSESNSPANSIAHPSMVIGGLHGAGFIDDAVSGFRLEPGGIVNTLSVRSNSAKDVQMTFAPTKSTTNHLFYLSTTDDSGNPGLTAGYELLTGHTGWWDFCYNSGNGTGFMAWSSPAASVGSGQIWFPRGMYLGPAEGYANKFSSVYADTYYVNGNALFTNNSIGSVFLNSSQGEDSEFYTNTVAGIQEWLVTKRHATTPSVMSVRFPFHGRANQKYLTAGVASPYAIDWRIDSGSILNNSQASEKTYIALPSGNEVSPSQIHTEFGFLVASATYGMRVTATNSKVIRMGPLVTAANGYLEAIAKGSYLRLKCVDINASWWQVVEMAGTWTDGVSTFGASTPSGSAGGDLGGTYPNPEVAAIHETSGPTKLTIGTITNGEFLKRVGTTIVSAAAGGGINVDGDGQLTIAATGIDSYGVQGVGTGANCGIIGQGGATGGGVQGTGGGGGDSSGGIFYGGSSGGRGIEAYATGNAEGVNAVGSGLCAGICGQGGATGPGGEFSGGTTSGVGIHAVGIGGSHGVYGEAIGSGYGGYFQGGTTNGYGVYAVGCSAAPGVYGGATDTGNGGTFTGGVDSGYGIQATGGPATAGVRGVGGTTSGIGGSFQGTGSGNGITAAGGTSGVGVAGTSGITGIAGVTGSAIGLAGTSGIGVIGTGVSSGSSTSAGVKGIGQGSGSGVWGVAGTSGPGGLFTGGSSSGNGITASAIANGYGVSGTGNGSYSGVYGTNPSGIGVSGQGGGSSAGGYFTGGSSGNGVTSVSGGTGGYGVSASTGNTVNAPFRIVPQAADPTTGQIGDIYVTTAGVVKICTVAGTPGTWISIGAQS